MFLPRSRRSIRASVFQANFWTTNDLSSSSRWPEVARSDSCASTFSRIETFPFCPFNHYLPVSISHRTFEHTFVPRLVHHSPHHCYTVYYLQLQTLLRTFQTPLDKIDQRVQFLDTRYHVYFVRGIIKGGKKNHSRRVKREKSQREIKNFSTRNAPFTFFTPGFWTHVQKLVYMSPMELSIVHVYTPFHVFTSLLFLSFVKQ